jgi:hypothetical protein
MTTSDPRHQPDPPQPDPHQPDPSSPFGTGETVRLHDAQDVLTAVPYVMGFQPDHCLVVLALDDAGRLLVTVRADLPDSAADAVDAADDLVDALRCVTPTQVLVVAYGDQHAVPVVTRFAAVLPWPIQDLLLVDEDRWWCLSCPDPGVCCPAGGTLHVQDAVAAPLLATSGAPAASRAARAACLSPGPQDLRDAVHHLMSDPAASSTTSATEAYAIVQEAHAARVDGPRPAGPVEAVAVLTALSDVDVRDACAIWADEAAVQLWLDVLPAAPPGWVAPVATLLAVAVYQRGDGALAALALERALTDDPAYSLARLMAQACDAGITPQTLTGILHQALADHPLTQPR